MKKLPRFLSSLFSPLYMQDLDVVDLLNLLNDPSVRRKWLFGIYEELRNVNLSVDRALLRGAGHLDDLSARRKALRDMLELLARTRSSMGEKDHDLAFQAEVDLDRVTV